MNAPWSKLLKSAYRKEPITSFAIIVGVVDAAIGGVDEHWSLLTFGLSTVGIAIALRLWQFQHRPVEPTQQTPKYYLPPTSARPALPTLTAAKRNQS
jgi:hypothetical protein